MTEDRFVVVSMDDPRLEKISEVLNNSKCKKIMNHLADSAEASQEDLSKALKIPISTVEYNVNKLLDSGFIQKKKKFFWSKKGKKIVMYELVNKSIVISPKGSASEKFKSILPAAILVGAGTVAIYVWQRVSGAMSQASKVASEVNTKIAYAAASPGASAASNTVPIIHMSPVWLWFLIGGILSLFIFSIINWRKL